MLNVGISCGQPNEPANGHVDTSDGTNFEDVARYSCHPGYMLNGIIETTCQADGLWSGDARTCESKMMELLFKCTFMHVAT